MGAGAWKTMYRNDVPDVPITSNKQHEQPNKFPAECEAPNGPRTKPNAAQVKSPKTGIRPNAHYTNALSNDNLVIIEAASLSPSSPRNLTCTQGRFQGSNPRRQMDVYGSGGVQSNRASPTIRSLPEIELPQPDTVRKVKNVFETLVKKQQEHSKNSSETNSSLKHHHSFTMDIHKPDEAKSNIGRSQSMLVLTGRAWCNGGPLVGNSHHHNGACSDPVSGVRAAFYQNGGRYTDNLVSMRTKPAYQRSCSELDKFFQQDDEVEDGDVDDVWTRVSTDRGSPVSPEVIQRIREKGTCVKFFGSEASVVGSTEDEFDDDDKFDDGNPGYLLDYPYDLYRSTNSCSPNTSEDSEIRKPKIISMVPKVTSDSSLTSSMASISHNSETSSPSPTYHNGWIIGGGCINGVSLDDIRASLNGDGMDTLTRSDSSLGSGYVRLKHHYDRPMSGHQVPMVIGRCHGKWMKNPYWQGSYYVVYDFTLKDVGPRTKINGI